MIAALLREDAARWRALGLVRDLDLPDGWIGAGFVRTAVWDALHGRAPSLSGDVDVVWFDATRADPSEDARIEAGLRRLAPEIDWSVRNQARMHRRNGDAPYASTQDAMRHWPETATAVAARRSAGDTVEVIAPYGLDDLIALRLRPTPRFGTERRTVFETRAAAKRWRERWPLLSEATAAPPCAIPSAPGSAAPRAAAAPPPAAGR
jgi:hypothetical protein